MITFVFLGGVLLILVFATALLVFLIRGDQIITVGSRVALIHLEGTLMDSQPTLKVLERYAKDRSVRAIVMRIETPGGAIGPTQEIFGAVRELNQKKRIIASMGSVAASGGYYVACGAERIFANPGTITGSIGVIVHFANLEKLLETIGVEGEVIKSGDYKDMGSPYRGLTPRERALLQELIDDVHGQFIEAVASSRDLPTERVRSLADGRIFSGRQAKELGLIDELGGLQEAIQEAARLAGIEGEPRVVEEPKEKFSLLDLVLGKTIGRILPAADPKVPFIGYLYHHSLSF